MKIKEALLSVLMILSYTSSFAQDFSPGYIFGNKGDTVSGYIEVPPLNRAVPLCLFKPTLNDPPTSLNAGQIKGFGYDDFVYVSTLIILPEKDTLVFTRLIFDGRYDLMYFEAYSLKHFIIRRPDSTILGIQYPPILKPEELLSGMNADIKFRQQTDSIFPDAPDLREYQKGVEPSINSLVTLFKQYHNRAQSSLVKENPLPSGGEVYKEGFIISRDNDTITGLIGNDFRKTYSPACIFSPGKNENPIHFMPDDIAGFGSRKGNRIFASARFVSAGKDTSAFVRLLMDGSIDLLYYEFSGLKNFLFREESGKIHILGYPPAMSKDDYLAGLNSSRKFRIIADSLLSSLGIPVKQKVLKPDIKSMVNLLEDYHSSNGRDYRLYNGSRNNMEIGPVAGVRFEKYNYTSNYDEYKSFSYPAPYAGLYFSLTNRKTGIGFILKNTLGYHRENYSYVVDYPDHLTYTQTSIRSLSNNLEAGVTFSPLRKVFPASFFEAGGTLRNYINPGYETLVNLVYTENNFVMSHRNTDVQNSNVFIGGFVRTGFSRSLRNNILRISGGYSYLTNNGSVVIHSFDLSAGYIFRIR